MLLFCFSAARVEALALVDAHLPAPLKNKQEKGRALGHLYTGNP
jgi:hypothetical protein